jgi:hypothetical protein
MNQPRPQSKPKLNWTVVDESGVAPAAIQGLNQKLNEKDAEILRLKQQNENPEKRLENLEQMVNSLTVKN